MSDGDYEFVESFSSQNDTQNFKVLREQCLRSKTLFEDPTFYRDESYRWIRPTQISRNPKFLVDSFSRFDAKQGNLGNCWFIAAVANLTLNRTAFDWVVCRDNTFEDGKYAGIFHFRFWRYGNWIEVIIDDYLPINKSGNLAFMHSSEPNEFWSALLEKAYVKLHGRYVNLIGGHSSEAFQDFTGGISELLFLKRTSSNLHAILANAFERQALIGASTDLGGDGLVDGHAYSVTKVALIEVENETDPVPLVRLRNPFGNKVEWTGAWSDNSSEWSKVHENIRNQLELVCEHDGEFWMSLDDFRKKFEHLEICHIASEVCPVEDGWRLHMFEGEWRAVGMHENPQIFLTLRECENEVKCTMILALMQKYRRKQGKKHLSIGLQIYRLRDGDLPASPQPAKFFENNQPAHQLIFRNTRENSGEFQLHRGNYLLMPLNLRRDEACEFMLRMFSRNVTAVNFK